MGLPCAVYTGLRGPKTSTTAETMVWRPLNKCLQSHEDHEILVDQPGLWQTQSIDKGNFLTAKTVVHLSASNEW